MVVLIPTRRSKKYDDPWLNNQLAEADKQSYFLIRNGEKLFRIWSNFIVGKTLVPTQAEFLDFFYEQRYNHTTHESERIPLEPGTRAYSEATKKADARSRHYLRIGLILQGLIDRTTVFHPLPGAVQVTRPEAYDNGWLQIIADGEFILADGHERFRDWQARLNATLDVGQRIIGSFSGWDGDAYTFNSNREHGRHARLTPANASNPRSDVLHRLEGRRTTARYGEREDGFTFLYDRTDEVYDADEGFRTPKVRASCVIYPRDRFIIAYDQATVEEMEYYLRSRQDRHEYTSLFPVLKAAIRMKRQEATDEEPFRQLLVGQIVATYGVDWDVAEALVPDLIQFYKFKNKYHRPLVGDDDGKALRMIVAECANVLRERAIRATRTVNGEFERVTQTLLATYPDALLIAHKAGNEYVVLLPHNDEDVFVTELTLTSRGVKETKEWRIVDTRYKRWHLLHTSQRWASWRINASLSDYLTDPEIKELATVAEHIAQDAALERRRRQERPGERTIIAVTFDRDDQAFHVYYRRSAALLPDALLLSSEIKQVDVARDVVGWKRTPHRTAVVELQSWGETVAWPTEGYPWDAGKYRRSSASSSRLRQRAEVVLLQHPEPVAEIQADVIDYQAVNKQREALRQQVHTAHGVLREQWLARAEAQRYQDFLREYGDPTLWEGHHKTLRRLEYPYWRNKHVDAVLSHLIERGIDLHGMRFGAAVKRYRMDVPDHAGDLQASQRQDADRIMPTDLDDLVLAPRRE